MHDTGGLDAPAQITVAAKESLASYNYDAHFSFPGDSARQGYLVMVRWPGHSADDILRNWWSKAPSIAEARLPVALNPIAVHRWSVPATTSSLYLMRISQYQHCIGRGFELISPSTPSSIPQWLEFGSGGRYQLDRRNALELDTVSPRTLA